MSQFYLPIERPGQTFGVTPFTAGPPAAGAPDWAAGRGLFALRGGSDGISICPGPPQTLLGGSPGNGILGNLPGYGPLGGLIAQFMNLMGQFMNMFSGAGASAENFYNDATASSTGDPHLAFSGTQPGGQMQTAHVDSMTSHQDLVDSDSVLGGYRVSTAVSAPNTNGVTVNQSATITTNYGGTQVTLDRNGAARIVQDGQPVTIAAGQTLDLGNGQTVTQSADGTLSVISVTGQGGTLNTTLKVNGAGVDVATSAHDADLGGDILNPQTPGRASISYPEAFRQPMSLA